jgi:hypothetical protein
MLSSSRVDRYVPKFAFYQIPLSRFSLDIFYFWLLLLHLVLSVMGLIVIITPLRQVLYDSYGIFSRLS